MTITLELSADEHAALASVAAAAGVPIETVLHGLIAQLSVPAAKAQETPDGDAAEEQLREQEEVEANIRRWHRERAQA